MTADELVAAAPADVVERIREARRPPRRRAYLKAALGLALAVWATLWLWNEAGVHGHRVAVLLGVAPVLAGLLGTAATTCPGPRKPLPTPGWVRLVRLAFTALTAASALAAWALAQRDGLLAGALLAPALVLPALGMLAPVAELVMRLRLTVRRDWPRRTQVATEAARARELDEIAWTLANRCAENEAPLRAWIAALPDDLAGELSIVPPVPGTERSGLGPFPGDALAAGVRRRTAAGGSFTVQPDPEDLGGSILLTTTEGRVFSLEGARRQLRKAHGWKRHAETAVAAEIARGPASLVGALAEGTKPTAGHVRWTVFVGGSQQQVPVGAASDRGVRLDAMQLPARASPARCWPTLQRLVSGPDASADRPHALQEHGRAALDAFLVETLALAPGVQREPCATLQPHAGERLTVSRGGDAGEERVLFVAVVPVRGPAARVMATPFRNVAIQCEALDLVLLLPVFNDKDRRRAAEVLAALLRREEQPLAATVYVKRQPGATGGRTIKRIRARPRRGWEPIDVPGLELGPGTVWWPVRGVAGV